MKSVVLRIEGGISGAGKIELFGVVCLDGSKEQDRGLGFVDQREK